MKKQSLFRNLVCLLTLGAFGQLQGQTVEFLTPDIVRITKTADGQAVEKQSL